DLISEDTSCSYWPQFQFGSQSCNNLARRPRSVAGSASPLVVSLSNHTTALAPFDKLRSSGRATNANCSMFPVRHVDLAHTAQAPRCIDEPADQLAPRLRLFDVAHDEFARPGSLVARGKADVADAGPLVEEAEIHPHVLDPVKLDLVD